MAKCGGCGKFLSVTDAAKCDKCSLSYHRGCVGISHKGTISSPWHCPECKKNVARDNQSETPVRGRVESAQNQSPPASIDSIPSICTALDAPSDFTLDFKTELIKIKEELISAVRHESQLLRNDIAEMRSALEAANDRMSNLEERVTAIENQKQSQPVVSVNVDNEISQLRRDLNDSYQELLANDIEIANLPEINGENPTHTAMLIAEKIGVKIEARDIVSAERVGGLRRINATEPATESRPPRPRYLVVRLTRRDLRDEMLAAARVRRGATSADLQLPGPPTRFYVNERLTKVNRQLFRKVRDIGNRLGWQFIWAKRGRILARNKPGDSVCLIRCEEDIPVVFGPAPDNDISTM